MLKYISIGNTERSVPNHGHVRKPRQSVLSDKSSSLSVSSTWVEVLGRALKGWESNTEVGCAVCLCSFLSEIWPSASSWCSGAAVTGFRCSTGWLDINQDQKQERGGKHCLDLAGNGEGSKLLAYLFPVEESKPQCGWPSCPHLPHSSTVCPLSHACRIHRECLAWLCVVIEENDKQGLWLSRKCRIYSFCTGISVASSLWG